MKPKNTKTPEIPLTARGLQYCDDCAGRNMKFHRNGLRNIYSTIMTYSIKDQGGDGKKFIRMDYGKFKQAMGRFLIEFQQVKRPSKLHLDNIRLLVTTYKGTKKLYEDVLRDINYGNSQWAM